MNDDARRAWWAHRQGLDGSLIGLPAATVLERTGWVRSVGGVTPYLALFARAGLGRDAIDGAVAALDVHELPAARGCTYVVPAADYALALQTGRSGGGLAEIATAKKHLGVTDAEIDRLCAAVLDALAAGPRDPAELKQAVGERARALGAEGKKRGLSTTLPLALGKLQSAGEIRRVPSDGRLDRQRYRYVRWADNPVAASPLTDEEAAIELARRFFRWIGPATVAEFRWFSGLGAKAAQAAIAPLGLVPPGPDDASLLLPDDLDAFRAFVPPSDPLVTLVGSLDGLALLRRNVADLLDPADAGYLVVGEHGGHAIGGLAELPNHGILDRGRLIGLWDFDPAAGAIVWATFGPPSGLAEVVARTEAFVREVGDARVFSLDSPQSRQSRLAALKRSAVAA